MKFRLHTIVRLADGTIRTRMIEDEAKGFEGAFLLARAYADEDGGELLGLLPMRADAGVQESLTVTEVVP